MSIAKILHKLIIKFKDTLLEELGRMVMIDYICKKFSLVYELLKQNSWMFPPTKSRTQSAMQKILDKLFNDFTGSVLERLLLDSYTYIYIYTEKLKLLTRSNSFKAIITSIHVARCCCCVVIFCHGFNFHIKQYIYKYACRIVVQCNVYVHACLMSIKPQYHQFSSPTQKIKP